MASGAAVANVKKSWDDNLNLRENLQQRLPKIVSKYFRRGRKAVRPDSSWSDLHRFRLATKRFRYTLELLRDLYGPGLVNRIEKLKTLQTLMGEANDYVTTASLLEGMGGAQDWRSVLLAKAETKSAQMRSRWESEFDAAGEEEKWIRYLVHFACRTPVQKKKMSAAAQQR